MVSLTKGYGNLFGSSVVQRVRISAVHGWDIPKSSTRRKRRRPVLRFIAVLAAAGSVLLAGCAAAGHSAASCAGPSLEAKPQKVAPGRSFRVSGEGFAVGCNDTGRHRRVPPDKDILLGFRQGERTWELSTTVADGHYAFGADLEVPGDARPGPAAVSASGANGRIEARLVVQGRETGKRPRTSGQGNGAKASGDLPGPEPPEATLSFGDRTVTGSLGSYCWSSGCADAAFPADESGALIPPDTDTLVVPANSEMVFDFGGERSSSVSATAYPLDQGDGPSTGPGEQQGMPEGKRLRVEGAGGQTRISGDLLPGAYLVDVFVLVEQGDVSYSYNVSIRQETK